MKNLISRPLIIGFCIGLVFSFLFLKIFENKQTNTITVKIPKVEKSFDTVYKHNYVKIPLVKTDTLKVKDTFLLINDSYDKELVDRYSKLESDYEKLKLFMDQQTYKKTEIVKEDSLVMLVANLEYKGEIITSHLKYKLKERDVVVKKPEYLKFYAAPGLMTDFNKLNYTLDLSMLKTNGNLYSVKYAPETKTGFLSVQFNLLNIKN